MKLPKYVMFKSENGELNCALSLLNNKYYRVAGNWSCQYKINSDGKITAQMPRHPQIHGKELVEVTEAEWRKDNEG